MKNEADLSRRSTNEKQPTDEEYRTAIKAIVREKQRAKGRIKTMDT